MEKRRFGPGNASGVQRNISDGHRLVEILIIIYKFK